MKKLRILIADDHALLRLGLRSYIAGKKDLAFVGEADNGRSAVDLARKLRPDVVVMDLMMPELSGAEATKLIRAELPGTHVLVLTSFATSPELSLAIENGASGALMKDTATETIIDAIRKVANGGRIMPGAGILRQNGNARPELTRRQHEMLIAITRGLSNADIGLQFGISGETVKKHLTIVFAKLGVANKAEAVALALREHLINI